MNVSTPLDLLERVADLVTRLPVRVVFLGGATTALHVTDPLAPAPRSTLDVDVVVAIESATSYELEVIRPLRALGVCVDDRPGAPVCRFVANGVMLDVMPTDPRVLGYANRWYASAVATAQVRELPSGRRIHLADGPHFVATKLEAFRGRGGGDYLESKDLEDIVAVVDGRVELVDECNAAHDELRSYLRREIEQLLHHKAFVDAVPAHLRADADPYDRAEVVLERLARIARAA